MVGLIVTNELPYVVLTARNFSVAARFATMQHAKAFSEQQLPGSHVVIDKQGFTRTRNYCREICDHGGSCSLELNHAGNHESKNDLGNITYCSWADK